MTVSALIEYESLLFYETVFSWDRHAQWNFIMGLFHKNGIAGAILMSQSYFFK